MPNFGRLPPRSPETFGIAGLLNEGCRVFYGNLFNTRNTGRVSDLIAAQLSGAGHSELRLRAILLFSLFEARSAQAKAGGSKGKGERASVAKPLSFECGIDDEKLGIAVTLDLGPDDSLDREETLRRFRSEEPSGPLEAFLVAIHRSCDQIVVRFQTASKRAEVVALVGLPGKIEPRASGRADLAIVEIPQGQVGEAPSAAQYLELGDLDQGKLETAPGAKKAATDRAGPDARIEGEKEPEGSGAKRVRALAKGQERGDAVRISGVTQHLNEDDEEQVFSGDGENEDDDEGESASIAAGLKSTFGDLFKKVWPFKGGEEGTDEDEDGESDGDEDSDGPELSPQNKTKKKKTKARAEEESGEQDEGNGVDAAALEDGATTGAEAAARRLLVEIQGGKLDQALSKAQKEMHDIKKDIRTPRAQRWVDGLMADLVGEKARLNELARKLNQSVRQKEVEFRNKEIALKEELRRRDEALRQKDSLVARTKDQVQQLRMTMERMKSSQLNAGEETHYRQKYGLVQKLYTTAKDENTKLLAQVEQLKNEASNLKYLAKKGEEYKKQYLAIADRAGGKGAQATGAAKRAETEAKMAAVYKKEAEDLRARTTDLQLKAEEAERETQRLRTELERLRRKSGGEAA